MTLIIKLNRIPIQIIHDVTRVRIVRQSVAYDTKGSYAGMIIPMPGITIQTREER